MTDHANEVLCTIEGPVARVTINRPASRNGLLAETAVAIYDALMRVEADRDVRVLVFRGAGRDFCVGADVKQTGSEDPAPHDTDMRMYDVTLLLHEMRAVTIAAVRGGCAGAGLGWAAACDLRVGAPDCRFNSAFLDVGVAGDMASPWLLPRLIGAGRARDLFFFPRKFDGNEAHAMGLLDRLFPAESFEQDLEQLVSQLATSAPLALSAMKANFIAGEKMDLASYLHLESARHTGLFATEDRREAFAAFIEKRKPRFAGR